MSRPLVRRVATGGVAVAALAGMVALSTNGLLTAVVVPAKAAVLPLRTYAVACGSGKSGR